MEAIVLAGGLGTRLREQVPHLPKPMAPIAGRPFLEILLRSLATNGFQRVVLSLGHMADIITRHFGDGFAGMVVTYEIESSPLGTGGAVRRALRRCKADHVFIFNGDTFLDLEAGHVEAHWQEHHAPIIVGREVHDTSRYGLLVAANGRVLGFSEKAIAGPGLVNAGCYVLPAGVLDNWAIDRPFSLETDFLAKAVAEQRFDLFVATGRFIDIGAPEDYVRAQTELASTCN